MYTIAGRESADTVYQTAGGCLCTFCVRQGFRPCLCVCAHAFVLVSALMRTRACDYVSTPSKDIIMRVCVCK